MVRDAGRSVQMLPVTISTLGGWHSDAHRDLSAVVTAVGARGMSTFSSVGRILFKRHAALLVTNSALCLSITLSAMKPMLARPLHVSLVQSKLDYASILTPVDGTERLKRVRLDMRFFRTIFDIDV